MVANTAKSGPAEKGGVLAGDVIVEVDGMDMQTATAELVAAKCRGEAGTNVNVAIKHNSGGKATPLTLTRAQVKVNPVESSTFVSESGKKIGLLRVSAFSQETVSQIIDALREVKGAAAVAVDLRGNAGGYMPAGVDVAKLFLPPQTRIISEMDKSGRATIYVSDGIGSETELPLYLLVDQRTASASEIMIAALQDNHRATVVGGSKTFGKGRIQNVQSLEDGSGVAVTKAKYMTPNGRDIHGVGITPDKESGTCRPDDSAAACLAGIV
jgi:carboxyl-terminal processing protease